MSGGELGEDIEQIVEGTVMLEIGGGGGEEGVACS